ncbi:DUF2971 domain-containing protein [Kaistella palustris]|uniref:DUF2971 domain-containing protein n=1 Tax=Kaistella palustris TaxID=493376 RepID=UPI0004253379|nr:DUF2971 domain-containing protein [Kaistella palustris]
MIITEKDLDKRQTEDFSQVLKGKRLYHYSNCCTTVDYILMEGTLNFTNPIKFNDPFDCSEKMLKVIYDDCTLKQTIVNLKFNRKEKRKFDINKLRLQQDAIMREERDKFKICCFSEKNDNLLMWSHYADKHSGMCCGFEFPIDNGKFSIQPVRYEKEIHEVEGKSESGKIIRHWLTSKSVDWEYEKEFRAILKSDKTSIFYESIKYDASFLKEMVFGCNLKTKDINKILSKLRLNKIPFKNIELKRAQLNPETFNLKIVNF